MVTKTSLLSISQHRTDILTQTEMNRRELENSIQTNVKKRPVLKVRFVRKLSNSSDIDALGL